LKAYDNFIPSQLVAGTGSALPVMIICVIIVFSPLFALNSARLSTAVTLHLTVTAPLLYFLAIRRTAVSKMTVIRVFVVAVLVAGLLLGGRSPLLHGIKIWISPAVEAMMVITVIWNIRRARRRKALAGSGRTSAGPEETEPGGVDPENTEGGGAQFSYARASGAAPVLGVFGGEDRGEREEDV
jgi:hypothetical protein